MFHLPCGYVAAEIKPFAVFSFCEGILDGFSRGDEIQLYTFVVVQIDIIEHMCYYQTNRNTSSGGDHANNFILTHI
jgi:hypothetical protein